MRFSETTKYLSNYLTFGRILSRLNKKMQAFLCIRCSKIWIFTRLFVSLHSQNGKCAGCDLQE
jgi:hypothetical protein